jgi:serine/threonine-protein kinase
LVTEFVAGRTLRSSLAAGPLPVERALDIARQLCTALAYLHQQGVVHRDIKPENILVAADGSIKLIDFGIARDSSERRITWGGQSKTMMGTPDYLSPEQLRGKRGDIRSDIYATGLVLYEMLTGHLPFAGETFFANMHSKIVDETIPPTRFRPSLAPNLSAIVCKAIARAPRDRYRSAADLLMCLRDPGAAAMSATEVVVRPHFRHHLVRRVIMATALVGLTSLVLASHYASPSPTHFHGAAVYGR